MWNSLNGPVAFRSVSLPFTARDLEARGATYYALGTDERYTQVFRGVWIDDTTLTEVPVPRWADERWLETWMRLTALRLLHPDLAGSHATAAELYGLPLPLRLRDRCVHVASADMSLRIVRPGMRLHRTRHFDSHFITLLDLPLVTIPLLVLELAPLLSVEELVQIGDAAIGKQAGGPYISLERLREKVLDRRRVPSRRRIEEALALMRPTVESPRESWLRLWCITNGFPEPVVHPPVVSAIGGCILHPDLGYPDLKIAIEYEGDEHRTSPGRFAADIRRRELMEAEGWVVLRVTKRTDMRSFTQVLSAHIASRGGQA